MESSCSRYSGSPGRPGQPSECCPNHLEVGPHADHASVIVGGVLDISLPILGQDDITAQDDFSPLSIADDGITRVRFGVSPCGQCAQ